LADTLIESAEIAFAIALALSALNLIVGLVRPSWAWATKRSSVVLRSLAIIVLAGVGFAGVIGYTLSLPEQSARLRQLPQAGRDTGTRATTAPELRPTHIGYRDGIGDQLCAEHSAF
jgi:hypothetical protein